MPIKMLRIDDRLMRPIDSYGRNYLLAMKKGIRISQSYAMRFHNLAVKKLETCQDEKQRTNLKRMIHALDVCPMNLRKICLKHYSRSFSYIQLCQLQNAPGHQFLLGELINTCFRIMKNGLQMEIPVKMLNFC